VGTCSHRPNLTFLTALRSFFSPVLVMRCMHGEKLRCLLPAPHTSKSRDRPVVSKLSFEFAAGLALRG